MITIARDSDVTWRRTQLHAAALSKVSRNLYIFRHNLNNIYKKTLDKDNFFKSIHIYRIPVENFLKSCRPIVELSKRALVRHGNEVYHGKAQFFLFSFAECYNVNRQVLKQF